MYDKRILNLMRAALSEYVVCGTLAVRPARLPKDKSHQLHVTKYATLYAWDEGGEQHGPTLGTDIVVEIDLRSWDDYTNARSGWKRLIEEIEAACHDPKATHA